jgi:photosystem II stability/assembly factor-like uncharacterized protein
MQTAVQWLLAAALAAGMVSGADASDAWFENLRTARVESDPSVVWRQFGPGMSGNNFRIFCHPTDPDTLFLGPNMGNAYRSIDRGATYESMLDWEGMGFKFRERGPIELTSPDFSRQDPDVGFCSAEGSAFLYCTTNRGASWQVHAASTSVWNGAMLNTITVDPQNDRVWYAGSGTISNPGQILFSADQPHGAGAAAGHVAKVWKTSDRGDSWNDITPVSLNTNAQITRILVHPGKSNMVFAATTYGLYKSTDGGTSWSAKTGTGLDHDIIRSFDTHYNPTNGTLTLYAVDLVKWAAASGSTVTNDGGGVFRSTDEGESWQCINGDLGIDVSALAGDYLFRMSYFDAVNEWFGITNAQTLYTVYPTNLMHSFSTVRVNPADPDSIFLCNNYQWERPMRGGMLWKTANGGAHWVAALRNGTAWEGVHKTYWEGRGNPVHPNIELRGQAKWQQKDSYERKSGPALEFNCDGSMIFFQWAKVLCVSIDGGSTWIENDEIEATPGAQSWVGAGNSNLPGHGLRQDPRLPGMLFLPSGENDFWITTPDGGNVRSGAQAARRIQLGEAEYSCSDVALHPTDTNIIYSLQFRQAFAGKLLCSTNGGVTLTDIGTAIEWPEGESFNDGIHQLCLTLDPDDPANMYFCIPDDPKRHGYTGNLSSAPKGVRKSSDGGSIWNWATNGLPASLDVPCIRLDPNDSSRIYACVYGDGGGLYLSTNRAASWAPFPTPPPGVSSVSDLHFSADGKMYLSCGTPLSAYTNGGVWMSADGGQNWLQIFKTPWARMTKTARYDPHVILVQMNGSNLADIQNPGTYLSRDGGATWSKINRGNPQSDRVNDIAIDQVNSNVYYVSTYGAGWLRGDLIDTNNVAPVFSASPGSHSNAVPEEFYAQPVGEAADANGDSIVYSLIFGPDWLSVTPDGSLIATPPAEALGDYLFQVQADDGNGMSSRKIMTFAVSTNPSAYYASWLRAYASVGSFDGYHEDPDQDGLSNLAEYGLGGDPGESGFPADIRPVLRRSGGGFEYVYRRRRDAGTRGIRYQLETTADLVSGQWVSFNPNATSGDVDAVFMVVTNSVPSAEASRFIRLRIRLE